MKICVFGAGAIGGYLGVLLAKAGADVSLVARGPHLAAMRENGLRLLMDGRELKVAVRCTDAPAELGPQDCVIVTLKAHALPGAAESMRPLLQADTAIVTAYNGLPYWYFHEGAKVLEGAIFESIDPGGKQWRVFGPGRAIGCVVNPATDIVAPGVIKHEYGNKFPIGEPGGETTPRIQRLHEIMAAAGLEAPIRANIRDEIWLKLWGNLCLNPISALTHGTLDVVAGDPGTRAVCRAMMAEAKTIGERLGLQFRVDAERRLDGAAASVGHKTSMLQDLLHGRPMEIDPIVTVVQEIGQRLGVATPTVDVVLALVKQRQAMALAATAS